MIISTFTGRRALTISGLIGVLLIPFTTVLRTEKAPAQQGRAERQGSVGAIAGSGGDFHIARRIVAGWHVPGGRIHGVVGKDVIDLDLDIAGCCTGGCSRWEQAEDGGLLMLVV